MLLTVLLCSAMLEAAFEQPVSAMDAMDAAVVARLPDHFREPDLFFQALFDMPVAQVNGEVIPARRILSRYAAHLSQISDRVSIEQFYRIVQDIIQRDLLGVVQAAALERSLIAELPQAQLDGMRETATRFWKRELSRLARELQHRDLENPLPVSLEVIQQDFIRQFLVRSYLEAKADAMDPIPNLNDLDEKAQQSYWKKRQAAINKLINDAVKQAKIDTEFAISWPKAD